MKLFYHEVTEKRKNRPVRLEVDNKFQQIKMHDLNNQNNVELFTTSIRGRKAFAAEQRIRELKTRVAKLNIRKLKISPTNNLKLCRKHELCSKQKIWIKSK